MLYWLLPDGMRYKLQLYTHCGSRDVVAERCQVTEQGQTTPTLGHQYSLSD